LGGGEAVGGKVEGGEIFAFGKGRKWWWRCGCGAIEVMEEKGSRYRYTSDCTTKQVGRARERLRRP
jgi:hypothetical protein